MAYFSPEIEITHFIEPLSDALLRCKEMLSERFRANKFNIHKIIISETKSGKVFVEARCKPDYPSSDEIDYDWMHPIDRRIFNSSLSLSKFGSELPEFVPKVQGYFLGYMMTASKIGPGKPASLVDHQHHETSDLTSAILAFDSSKDLESALYGVYLARSASEKAVTSSPAALNLMRELRQETKRKKKGINPVFTCRDALRKIFYDNTICTLKNPDSLGRVVCYHPSNTKKYEESITHAEHKEELAARVAQRAARGYFLGSMRAASTGVQREPATLLTRAGYKSDDIALVHAVVFESTNALESAIHRLTKDIPNHAVSR